MIKKIIIFSENNGSLFNYMKTPSSLRLSYSLRNKGYEVKQVHNCTSFNKEELQHVIDKFSNGEEVCVLISTSFLTTSPSFMTKEEVFTDPKKLPAGYYWASRVTNFFNNLFPIIKNKNIPLLMGGYDIVMPRFLPKSRHAWNCDYLSEYVTFFIVGNDIDIIEKVCRNESFPFQQMGNSRVAQASTVTDFTDCASTPIADDLIFQGEALATEIAAGCIFSCQFCNYAALGKKKYEYMRTYESFKREIISNYENFKTTTYLFTDNLMNDNLEKLKFILKVKEETGIDIKWSAFLRLDTIKTKEQAKMIAESGGVGITVGIESFKKEVGPFIGKITDKNKVINSLYMLREAVGENAILSSGFIAGLPTETEDELYKTFEWLQSAEGNNLLDHYNFSYLKVFTHNKDKNNINAARNDPFSQYIIGKHSGDWVSPWGNSERYFELSNEFNSKLRSIISGFAIPVMNNLGMKVEETVSLARMHNRELEIPIMKNLKEVNYKRVQHYKQIMKGEK
jgi:Radical SAM superfamily